MAMLTTSSPSSGLIPMTPRAGRPMGRTWPSSNLTARPFFVARMISLLPSVSLTSTSLSPSSRPRAMRPRELTLAYAASGVFLTMPARVAKTR